MSLDTLKELNIVPWNFPTLLDSSMREHKTRRVAREYDSGYEEEEELQEQKEERQLFTLQERAGSLRSKIKMKEMSEEDWEDEKQCWELKQAWLKDFPEVFKEDLGKEDRMDWVWRCQLIWRRLLRKN